MKRSRVKGIYSTGKSAKVTVEVPVIIFEEDGVTFIYTPALDLTGYGRDEDEARASFGETLEEFLRYTINKGTLHDVLVSYGWKVGKNRKVPRSLVHMLTTNEYLARIFEEKQYKKAHETVHIPLVA